jgi:hypothetical protein
MKITIVKQASKSKPQSYCPFLIETVVGGD